MGSLGTPGVAQGDSRALLLRGGWDKSWVCLGVTLIKEQPSLFGTCGLGL